MTGPDVEPDGSICTNHWAAMVRVPWRVTILLRAPAAGRTRHDASLPYAGPKAPRARALLVAGERRGHKRVSARRGCCGERLVRLPR
jgi:hypothetical protein